MAAMSAIRHFGYKLFWPPVALAGVSLNPPIGGVPLGLSFAYSQSVCVSGRPLRFHHG
jgi:hypothetical protein